MILSYEKLKGGHCAAFFKLMATLLQLKARLEQLNEARIASDAVQETSGDLSEKNRQQLHGGFNKKGEKIGDTRPYRNRHYARLKAGMNSKPGFGNPDLKLTGAFYRQLKTDVQGELIHTTSADSKTAWLQKKYSDLFGLGGDFKTLYIEENLRPAFLQKLKEATGLK